MKTRQYQEKFFDKQPNLYPWPNLLVEMGFSKNYKPRDVKFKKYLNLLGMKKGEKVLDVGCGEGIFLARVAKTYGADCTGIDISKRLIATAKSLRLRSGQAHQLRFRVADATQLPFKDNKFDYVLSFDVLEHIQNQGKVLFEMMRVLKPGGLLLLYSINKNQRYTWNFWLDKLGVDVYKRVAHNPSLFPDPDWVKKELERMGIEVKRLELFNSFFTLAFDETIMLLLLGFRRLSFFDSPLRFKVTMGRAFLNLSDFLSHFSLALLEVLEIPWKKSGYSNSFFVLGRKRGS